MCLKSTPKREITRRNRGQRGTGNSVVGLGDRTRIASQVGLAAGSLLLLASPAFAACTSSDPTPSVTSTGNPFLMGDEAYAIAPSTGLYFQDSIPGGANSLAITNGVVVDSTGTGNAGLEIRGRFDVCYDGLAAGSIVSDVDAITIDALGDMDVLLGIAHAVQSNTGIGIEVMHGGDGLIDITATDVTGGFAGISITRNDDGDVPDSGNDITISLTGTLTAGGRGIVIDTDTAGDVEITTNVVDAVDTGILVERNSAAADGDTAITAEGAISAGAAGIVAFTDANGDVTIDAQDDVDAVDGGIAVQHGGAVGDISISTAAGSEISAHGGSGFDIYAVPFDPFLPVGIYVDRSAANPGARIDIDNNADIGADGIGIYVDICSCAQSIVDIQSTGDIVVDDGTGTGTAVAFGAGIYVSQGNDGDVTVNQTGSVTVADGLGVVVDHYGDGDISASATGGIAATDAGVLVTHAGAGNVAVTAGGIYDISDGSGIEVYHDGTGTVGITSTATMHTDFDAIVVEHDTGNTTISQTGKLTVDDGAGMTISQFGNGDVVVNMTGDIDATDGGIGVNHQGKNGTIAITTSAGSTISASAVGTGIGIGANRSNFGPGTGIGGIVIDNRANIVAGAVGIFATLCDCSPGDVSITSTGTMDVGGGGGGFGIFVLHDGEGGVTVNTPGRIAVDGAGFAIGVNITKSGDGAIDVTTGEISAATAGISVDASDDVDIDVKANGKITTPAGVGIAVASEDGDIDVTTAAGIEALEAGVLIDRIGDGNTRVTTSGGKLTASGGTTMTYGASPITGSAGIHVTHDASGSVTIGNGSAIETDGVGIYVESCSCLSPAIDIASSGNITSPFGIYATTAGTTSLNQTAGTIKGTHGVTLAGSSITGTIAAGAKIEVNGTGAGRYGASFTGPTDLTVGGTVDAPGTDALLFTGGNAKLTLLPGFVINGQVDALDTATNDLIFGGATGNGAFDLDRIGTGFTDFDTLTKTGNSSWTFSGDTFTGLLTAKAGTVVINSSIPGLDLVLENTTFHGNAGLKSLTTTGGTLAPGNSIGLVTVAGDATIGAGTAYGVEVNAAGANDKLVAGGTVTIDPTASVDASMEPGTYGAVNKYTIITGATAVTGAFGDVDVASAFYTPTLTYDANNAYLTLTRNSLTLGDFANTPNQQAAADALDAAGLGAPYFDELFVLPAGDVPGALDAISGDGYASLAAAGLDDSRFVRDAALDRRGARGIWSTPYGGVSHLPGDGNGPAVDHATGGLLLGADGPVGDGYLGMLLGYGQSRYIIADRNMSATSGEFSLGSYGGADWNQFYASFGGAITARNVDAARDVVFPGVSDTVRAQYASLTAQAFGEIGYRLETGGTTVTPFGGLAGLQSATTGYTETGSGAGALKVDASTASAFVATLGLRVEHEIAVGDDKTLTLRTSAAWKHAMGSASTSNSMTGTGAFTVAGAPLAADTLAVTAGAALDMGQLSVGLDYTGSLGSGGMSNAATATLAGEF